MLAVFHNHILSKRVLSSALEFNNKSTLNLYIVERMKGVKSARLLPGLRRGMVFSGNPYSIKRMNLSHIVQQIGDSPSDSFHYFPAP